MSELAAPRETTQSRRPHFRSPDPNDIFELLNLSHELVCFLSGPELRVEFVNTALTRLVGSPVVGAKAQQVLFENLGLLECIKQVYESGRAQELREAEVWVHGQKRYLNMTLAPREDSEQKISGVIALGLDVSELVLTKRAAAISKERLQFFLESAQMGTWVWDLDSGRTTVSARASEIIGAPIDENLRDAIERVVHPEDRSSLAAAMEKAVRDKTPFSAEYRVVHPDTSVHWALSRGSPSYDDRGRPIEMAGVTMDITESKAAAQLIAMNEQRFRTLFEFLPLIIWTASADTSIEFVNSRWYEYTGLTLEQTQKSGFTPVLHPDDLEATNLQLKIARETKRPIELELRLKRADCGSYRWFLMRAIPVYDHDKNLQKWFGTLTDIHDHKRLAEELKLAKIQADNANESKSAFLANMSHEIRTPLGAILGFTGLLEASALSYEQTEYVKIIHRNGQELMNVLDDILDISKIEAGKLEFEFLPFSLDDLLQQVLILFSDKASAKGLSLRLRQIKPGPHQLISDGSRLRQILINLIGNAVKFTSHGTISVDVDLVPTEGSLTRLLINVEDTGPGLSLEQQQKLFKPFSQADASTSRKHGGTGLGLALSRKLAEALGGSVRLLRSSPGEGCIFQVEILAQVLPEPPMKMNTPKPPGDRESKRKRLENIRILGVDDSADNRFLMKLLLEREGAQFSAASRGEDALDLARHQDYDVILMDIQMPGLDGYETLTALRGFNKTTPVIALTAHAMLDERYRTLSAGFDDHVTKPFDVGALVESILRLLAQSRGQIVTSGGKIPQAQT